MGVLDSLLGRRGKQELQRSALGFDQWLTMFSYNGVLYPVVNQTLPGDTQEVPDGSFYSYVQQVYQSNGIVFACMLARQLIFSEARFMFRRLRSSGPGDLFGNADLRVLQSPWPGGTTGDLLTRAIQDADLAGNFFAVRRPNGIKRLRPDWVTIVMGSPNDPDVEAVDVDAEVIGYIYKPGGAGYSSDPVPFLASEVAHFAPIPDPCAWYRGMSWLTPIIREVLGDSAATAHKLKFFEHGATPNMVVSLDPAITKDAYQEWVKIFDERHAGVVNAYKTLYLGGGAQASTVGSNLEQMEFKVTQGAGETRIAAAARVPPIIVGLSEGLEAATYSNYGQARRAFSDATIRPLWRNFAGSMQQIITTPSDAELWYDDRDIAFLQEDEKDAAEIMQLRANAVRTFVDSGYEQASAVAAVAADDITLLKPTGYVSVQLQQLGSPAPVSQNGNGTPAALRSVADRLLEITQGGDAHEHD